MAQNDLKRRLINQLPAVLQTDVLKNFFATTVDNLFQPGTSVSISGYIGQKPSYYDPTKDFYLEEPTAVRQAYQLEPAMVSVSNNGTFSNTLCYDDLINYMQSQGSITSNHSRMFEGDYYSWAPPVDLDKLNNYLQYFWMGALTDEEKARLTVVMRAPSATYVYDGNASATYPLPPALIQFTPADETPMVTVNGVRVSATFDDQGAATISAPNFGDIIQTYRYGDLKALFTGKESIALWPFIKWTSSLTTTTTANAPHTYNVGDLVYYGDDLGNGDAYRCITAHTVVNGAPFDDVYWTKAPDAVNVTSSMRAEIHDATGTNRYIFDGVGTNTVLSPDYSQDPGGAVAHYIVIDRRSQEQSPWARRNLWVHKTSVEWSGMDLTSRKAERPIIEFLPNIELYNYGSRRLEDVQAMLSDKTQADIIDHYDIYPHDDNVWDQEKVNLSRVNGKFFGRLHDANYAGPGMGTETDEVFLGSVVVDNDYVLQPNDRLFVNQVNSPEPELNHYIYRAVSNPDTPLPDGAEVDAVELIMAGEPKIGDIFRYIPGLGVDMSDEDRAMAHSVFADPVEYWYNGVEWAVASTGEMPPLFMLYDSDQNKLSDTNVYANTDFAGNRLFSYQVGTGADDPVLGFPLVFNAYAQPVFQIDEIIHRVNYTGGEIGGYYYHHFVNDDTYSNNWFPVAEPSSQALVDGVYQIPLNLQANPGNFEVETISRNQWFDHFSSIMEQQDGFTGHPYSTNNWRDTAKELGHGDKILQHRSPLLKTMLLASDTRFDLPSAIRYVEQEYVRFRNRFVQCIVTFYENGTLGDQNTADEWVDAVLDALRLNKTTDFPFALNTMAGGQYFIPPTAAYLGLGIVTPPELFVDTTTNPPRLKLRGHDGSEVDAFGNLIDNIRLAFEQRVYDNIDPSFKTENRPVFDLSQYVNGKFYTDGDYFTNEIDQMLSPSFERWAQANNKDYRLNVSYIDGAPFTWNYSQSLDRDGQPLPGYWRGIYHYYFDTDRPHLAPWEMLGFVQKPEYWDSEYGLPPYTRGNTKLWDDMRDGRIAGGAREGVDPRYARPDLYLYLPVDDEGRLMDPIASGIVTNIPTYQQASASWKMGDWSPAEYEWRSSVSYPYALSLVGFLAKPARFVEQGWDTINTQQDGSGQWIYTPTGNRPLNKDVYVHGELTADGTAYVVATGNQQWMSDYMLFKGQDPSLFGTAIRGLDVRLAHKMASFTSTDNLRAMADNFGLVPAEDVTIQLVTSPSIREEVYSGVLIEWTGQGYRVIGYDTRTPVFKVAEPMVGGPKGYISLSDVPEPIINPWQPGRYYPLNTSVSYMNTVYKAIKAHTSSTVFDQNQWVNVGAIPQPAPRVVTYVKSTGRVIDVPYGTVLPTWQDVADFMLGYESYLISRGWVFDQVNADQETLDWTFSVKEFLQWAQVNWEAGSFISVSPSARGLHFHADQGMVLDVLKPINGVYGMLDRTGLPIDRQNVVVNRIDGDTELLSKNIDIYGARVNIGEIEHVLFFSNETIFNDIIYSPLYNLRQPRLRLIGRSTTGWTGRLDAPGYILSDNEIIPNFDKAAEDLLTMWDIEQADNVVLRDHVRHLIGYDDRDYLSSLVLSEIEQLEFYQGMIHQKGAPGAFDKLARSDYIEQNRELKFFEEWAIKLDEYGAISSRDRVAFLLGKSEVKRNPQVVHFRTGEPTDDLDLVELVDNPSGIANAWVERLPNPLQSFPVRDTMDRSSTDLPASGYVRLTEVQNVVFSFDDVAGLYDEATDSTIPLGTSIWVHDTPKAREFTDGDNTVVITGNDGWDVYRAYNLSADGNLNTINSVVTRAEDVDVVTARIFMANPHGLTTADLGSQVVFDGSTLTDPDLHGVQIISAVTDDYFEVLVLGKAGYDFVANFEVGPEVRILRSVRFKTMQAFVDIMTTRPGVQEGEYAYVDGQPWRVMQMALTTQETDDYDPDDGVYLSEIVPFWKVVRIQTKRMDTSRWASSLIYDLKTQITPTKLMPEPLILNRMNLSSPLTGKIVGRAESEIDFKLEYDPAVYTSSTIDIVVTSLPPVTARDPVGGPWGKAQVGRVWWDLSTVRFLETYTDDVTFGHTEPMRYRAELDYRSTHWAKIAPATSVDVYEWTRSLVPPTRYVELSQSDKTGTYDGEVYKADSPSWVETVEYDPQYGSVTVYYFWVKNKTTTPFVDFRKLSSLSIARIITDPQALDIPWIAPIMPNAVLMGSVDSYLDDVFDYNASGAALSGTVVQIEIDDHYEGVTHDEWLLMRPLDERSLPPDWLWDKMRDSLVGFDNNKNPVAPSPPIPAVVNVTPLPLKDWGTDRS